MANVRPVRRRNQGFAEVTNADNILSGGFNTPTLAGPPGGTPSPGTVTYFTNTAGFLVRTNSAGLSTVVGPLFTRVVTTDAELTAALASTDDFFIVAGAYTFDVTAPIGVGLRTIWGAGMDKVTITLITGGPPGALDFSASQSIIGGVVIKEMTITSASPAVGPGLLIGAFGVVNVRVFGTVGITFGGFLSCFNLVNCIALGIFDTPGSFGYSACIDLVNCRIEGFNSLGFSACQRLSNCFALADDDLSTAPSDHGAFNTCVDLANCVADYSLTVIGSLPHHAFFLCERVSNGQAIGPPAPVVGLLAYTGCSNISTTKASGSFETNYSATNELVGCRSEDALFDHFVSCTSLTGCIASFGTPIGFAFCDDLAGCDATGTGGDGFSVCDELAGCRADSNTGDGFDTCTNLSACIADDNGAFGYLGCDRISASEAGGNFSGAQSGCTRISLNTTTFDHFFTPTALAANANDFDLEDAQIARLAVSGGADRTVTGIDVSLHPSPRIDLINVDPTFNILLADQDVGSLATNRIITGTSASITIAPDGAARLLRDSVTDRWRVVQS